MKAHICLQLGAHGFQNIGNHWYTEISHWVTTLWPLSSNEWRLRWDHWPSVPRLWLRTLSSTLKSLFLCRNQSLSVFAGLAVAEDVVIDWSLKDIVFTIEGNNNSRLNAFNHLNINSFMDLIINYLLVLMKIIFNLIMNSFNVFVFCFSLKIINKWNVL